MSRKIGNDKEFGRRNFLSAILGSAGIIGLTSAGNNNSLILRDSSGVQERIITLKGRQDSAITHWDVITIGNLSRNRYWGESDEKAIHNVICTCTVISGKNFHVIVDPSIADENLMKTELNRLTGLLHDNIDMVFITHQHGDHVAGLKHFQKSRWVAGSETASILNKSGNFAKQIEPGAAIFLEQ